MVEIIVFCFFFEFQLNSASSGPIRWKIMVPRELLNSTVTIPCEDVPIFIVMLRVVIFYKIINYYLLFVLMKPKMRGKIFFFSRSYSLFD